MWEAHPEVLVTDLGDELVLMHTGSSQMFQLNGSGRIVWQALPATTRQIASTLTGAFEVEDSQAERDADTLLADLEAKKLIQRR
jgi:hypothetical protein